MNSGLDDSAILRRVVGAEQSIHYYNATVSALSRLRLRRCRFASHGVPTYGQVMELERQLQSIQVSRIPSRLDYSCGWLRNWGWGSAVKEERLQSSPASNCNTVIDDLVRETVRSNRLWKWEVKRVACVGCQVRYLHYCIYSRFTLW